MEMMILIIGITGSIACGKSLVSNYLQEKGYTIIDAEIGNLTNDYQIGGSYFKALDEGKITQEELWKNKLEPLLEDYFRGERDLEEKLEKIKEKYFGEENDTNAN